VACAKKLLLGQLNATGEDTVDLTLKALQEILTGPAARFHGQPPSPPVGRLASCTTPPSAHSGAAVAAAAGAAAAAAAAAPPHPAPPPVVGIGALGAVMAAAQRQPAAQAAAAAAAVAGAGIDATGAPSYKNGRGMPLMQEAFNALCISQIKRDESDVTVAGVEAMIRRPTVNIDALYDDVGVGPLVDTYAPSYFPGLPELTCLQCNGPTIKDGFTRPRRAHAFHCDWWFVGRRIKCAGGCASFNSYDADAVAQYAANIGHGQPFSYRPSPSSTTSRPSWRAISVSSIYLSRVVWPRMRLQLS
jgi:hypothetical protein